MIRRRIAVAVLGLGIAPVLTGCPAPPGAAPAPAADAAAPAPGESSWSADLLARVNAERANAGLPALAACATLDLAAQRHSDDQAARSTMSHTGGDGSDLGTRADRAGYRGWNALGENVAYGYGSPASVMAGWMSSSGHRGNILSGSFTNVGFGLATSASGTPYWTQDFGRNGSC